MQAKTKTTTRADRMARVRHNCATIADEADHGDVSDKSNAQMIASLAREVAKLAEACEHQARMMSGLLDG